MLSRLKKISLGNWILIGMLLGLIVGLLLNFYVTDPFIKDIVLMNNVFYLGGNLFIKLMKMLVVPLVFFSIVVGVASISDIRTIGSIILNLVPDNPFSSLATGDMLPVIIFGLLIGIILAKLREETETFNKIFTEGNKIMMEMTSIVMKFAPIGVFCLMARTFGGLGFDGMLPLGKYVVCVLIGLAIQGFVIYPSLLVLFTRLNPIKFFKRFFSVMFFAFSSSTSNATIPLNMEKLHEMGVSRDVSSFTIPLGATINMDGTAIMQGVAVMFAAQAYGIDLGTSALLTVIFTAVMASVGTAGIPSVGLVTLTMVFNSVGLPVQAIGVIFGIDHILDMFRTAINVTGDAICTIIVSFRNKAIDLDIYNGKKPPEEEKHIM